MSTEPSTQHPFGDIERFRTAITYLKEMNAPHTDEDYAHLMAFYFELPFQVPWPERPIAISLGNTFVIIIFQHHQRAIQSHYGLPTTEVVTGVTLAGPEIDPSLLTQSTASDLFDFGLWFLNTFLISYSVVTKDGDVRPVTLPMLSPVAEWGRVRPFENEATVQSLMIINPSGAVYEKPPVPDAIGAAVMNMATVVSRGAYPFLTSWSLWIEGQHALWRGRYNVATILTASAFEARVNELVRYFCWKEGKTEAEMEAILAQPPFSSRVKSQLHPRLGGNFDYTKSGLIKHWYQFTNRLRNKIIHGGYTPSREEATHAMAAMVQAWDYLMSLARKKKKKYPELQPFIQNVGGQFVWPRSVANEEPPPSGDPVPPHP